MSFEADLNAHLMADAAINTVTGDRIWPLVRDEGSDLPAITHQVVTPMPATDLDGDDTTLFNYRVQVDIWAHSYDAVRTLAELVRTRMKTPATTFSSLSLSGGGGDDYEPETKIYRVSMDFSMWYSAP